MQWKVFRQLLSCSFKNIKEKNNKRQAITVCRHFQNIKPSWPLRWEVLPRYPQLQKDGDLENEVLSAYSTLILEIQNTENTPKIKQLIVADRK